METPSSTKRVTRSQTQLARTTNNIPVSRKIEDSCEKGVSKSRRGNGKQQQQQDRSALFDITNDSPIVGLAMGSLETPSSAVAKQSTRAKNKGTPGSGEALLRGQVKTLLQKVEEEAELSKLSMENRPFLRLQGFVNSPMGLLAPTPANTPQVPNLSGDGVGEENGLASLTPLPVVEEQLDICCQAASDIFNGKKQESLESQKSLTRSLLLDFSEKSEISDSSECSSVLTYQEVVGAAPTSESWQEKSFPPDDDGASVWSIQVNASSTRGEEEEEYLQEEEEDYYYHNEEDDGMVDELCDVFQNVSVNEAPLSKFTGKHKRFVYNEDGELVGEAEESEEEDSAAAVSPSVVHLKGLPTPKGKHLRFPEGEN